MKSIVFVFCLIAASAALAVEPALAPTVDKKFLGASAFNLTATLADSYTTSWLLRNWNRERIAARGHWEPCIVERGEPYFYGLRPSPARSYGVGLAKVAITETAAYLLKRRGHGRLWVLPLLANGADSSVGAAHNFASCD
ncbi:MAG TPA: hypothetical protein VJX23_03075 [Candidatus Binataceae bacterium]|nr:hypothetical protein [Candidatus Binataceae bacterium]